MRMNRPDGNYLWPQGELEERTGARRSGLVATKKSKRTSGRAWDCRRVARDRPGQMPARAIQVRAHAVGQVAGNLGRLAAEDIGLMIGDQDVVS